jgi:hypothetical protein
MKTEIMQKIIEKQDELLALFDSETKEQNQVIEILKGHVDDLQEQIAKRDELIRLQDMSYCNLMDWFENGSVYDHNKERLAMDEQINKLKAEIE